MEFHNSLINWCNNEFPTTARENA